MNHNPPDSVPAHACSREEAMVECLPILCRGCTSVQWQYDLPLALTTAGGHVADAFDAGLRAVSDPTDLVILNTGEAMHPSEISCLVRK